MRPLKVILVVLPAFLLSIVACTSPQDSVSNESVCLSSDLGIQASQLESKNWDKCDGETIKIQGEVAKEIYSHPTGLHMSVNSDGEIVMPEETYVNVGPLQFVITSEEKISCKSGVEVFGTLDVVEIETNDGITYQNYWIISDTIECL